MATKKRTVKKFKPAKRAQSSGTSLPKLKWSEYEWRGQTTLPAGRGFHTKFPSNFPIRSKKPSTGKVKLTVSTPDEQKVPPSPAQIRAFDYLVEHQQEVRDIILKAVMKAYPKKLAPWFVSGEPIPEVLAHLPKKFARPDELKPHTYLATVYVLKQEKSGMAYIGYGLEATWEVEHGLGIVMHGNRILDIGDEEVAVASDAID